jgi:hypothetical protein
LLVVAPSFLRGLDIILLALLRAAAEQDYERVSVLAEVNAVAGPKSIRIL